MTGDLRVRLLAIGDIHGCFQALTTLVDFVPIASDDLVVTLGDYVNRGPDTRAVIEWLIDRERQGQLVPLLGNHEIMMLRARDDVALYDRWLTYGGDTTLASYSRQGDAGALSDVPAEHWEFLEHRTRAWYETETHFFVHAYAYPHTALADQPDVALYWERFHDSSPHCSGKVMVCGHTAQKSGLPLNLGHAVCIDTWVYGRGWLTCLDMATGHYWQANQHGDTRESNLS